MSASATGSRPGSIARPFGLASSVGRPGSSVGPGGGAPGSLDRRAGRITSASPLLGRGQRYSSLELPLPENDDELLGLHEMSVSNEAGDFQLPGPAAGSQWTQDTLDRESGNFLHFVTTEITNRNMARGGGTDEEPPAPTETTSNAILFEDLLPTVQHTKLTAAQGFHHVLALATKGLIDVQQNVAYGPITLRLQAQI